MYCEKWIPTILNVSNEAQFERKAYTDYKTSRIFPYDG